MPCWQCRALCDFTAQRCMHELCVLTVQRCARICRAGPCACFHCRACVCMIRMFAAQAAACVSLYICSAGLFACLHSLQLRVLCVFESRLRCAGLHVPFARGVLQQHGAHSRALLTAQVRLWGSAPALAPDRRRDSLPARLPQGIPGAPAGKALAPPQRLCSGRAAAGPCVLGAGRTLL